jgi:hypothetical protein
MSGRIGWAAIALASLLAGASRAETDTVLLCYPTNVLRFAVEDGVWSARGDFAHRSNAYGGIANSFTALASDGRRVFVGESGSAATRILEFGLDGTYLRRFALIGTNIEHMCASQDGRWVYATVGSVLNNPTDGAVVHQYDAVTGEGGVFIPNQGTNSQGEVLWKLQALRGVAADNQGRLWVSNRNTGEVFLFSEADGAYLGAVGGMTGIQALHVSPADQKVYATSSGNNSYVIGATTLAASTVVIADLRNRLGLTQVQGQICSGIWDRGEVRGYDLVAGTRVTLIEVPIESRQIITLPRAPLRSTLGHLLLAETASNRVTRLTVDAGYVVDAAGTFAGGGGVTYGGLSLRSPRGLVARGDTVYVAEGVAGGRVLKFSKWGTFKSVAADFSQTAYAGCVPAALALAPDGTTLYVTDAHTLFIAGNNVSWANVPSNGYYNVNGYGETVYKVDLPSRDVSVFADSSSLSGGNQLLEPQGLAVDDAGNVYCTAWFNKVTSLSNGTGSVYQFSPAGVRTAGYSSVGNPSVCYYDPVGVYSPAATNALIGGPGILYTGNGVQDFWWTPAGGNLSVLLKMLDLGNWRNYLDLEIVDGRMWFTDPEYGTLWRRTGETTREVVLTGLGTPTYLTYVTETGPEPPPSGTVLSLK